MFSKANLISTLVTAIWSFMGGYVLWGLIGDPFLKEHLGTATGLMKNPPNFGMLALGCLIQAFVFSTIYSKWARSHHSLVEGAKYGLWIGLLVGYGDGIINFATSNMLDITGSLVNGLIYVIFYAIMGVLASLIYSKVRTTK